MANPSRHSVTIPSVRVAAQEEVQVLSLTAPLSWEERLGVIASMVSVLRSRPASHLRAVELVVNILLTAVPEMATTMGTMRTFSLRTRTCTSQELKRWAGLDDSEDGTPRPALLPSMTDPNPSALAVTSTAAVYAGVASILFAIGKQASENAQVAALDKRPDALIRRFEISEGDKILLPGREAGPTRESLETIYNAFATYSEARAEIVRFFLGVRRSAQHYPLHLEVLMTNFNLMRGAGMTHVDSVLRLARMHPWVIKVPELTPYFARFTQELAKFQTMDEDVRMYHRLLSNQSDFLFVSSEYRPLVAVAGSLISEVEKTFKGYVYNQANYQELVDKVMAYAPQYRPTQKLTAIAQMLDIPEAELPLLVQKKEEGGEEVV